MSSVTLHGAVYLNQVKTGKATSVAPAVGHEGARCYTHSLLRCLASTILSNVPAASEFTPPSGCETTVS